MINNFNYSYISICDEISLAAKTVQAHVNVSLSYSSHNINYTYDGNSPIDSLIDDSPKFIKNLVEKNKQNITSGLLPPAIKYNFPGVIVFERPPSYQVIQYADATVHHMNDDCDIFTYRVAVPWQLYIITYDTKAHFCNSVKMLFMKSSLNSPDQKLYMPPIPNFFTNGSLCRPMYDSFSDLDSYSKDISGVIASAYDWVWNSGFNHDLTENFYYVVKQSKPKELVANIDKAVSDPGSSYYKGINPSKVKSILSAWEKIDLTNILNIDWPNPSLTEKFEADSEYYNEYDWDRFSVGSEEDCSDSFPDLTQEYQTYQTVIDYTINCNSDIFQSYNNIDNDFLQTFKKTFSQLEN